MYLAAKPYESPACIIHEWIMGAILAIIEDRLSMLQRIFCFGLRFRFRFLRGNFQAYWGALGRRPPT